VNLKIKGLAAGLQRMEQFRSDEIQGDQPQTVWYVETVPSLTCTTGGSAATAARPSSEGPSRAARSTGVRKEGTVR